MIQVIIGFQEAALLKIGFLPFPPGINTIHATGALESGPLALPPWAPCTHAPPLFRVEEHASIKILSTSVQADQTDNLELAKEDEDRNSVQTS